ncbi:DUF2946 family protein [Luteimonas sp. FCS-9]|uniref:DUF2946 family protein n=1 Tax=Luteimonas sp. FCS-9 TaxID=1547516 RepID=UPI00063ECA83|nr:DUF2946 family protein [Luteimonas sp. FCS-9]KLI99273.1 hypothetical protein WQ56_12785 [Luteimonas sp. FCS-9]
MATRTRRARIAPSAWHWLALLAMLLLAVAPAISRIQAGAGADPGMALADAMPAGLHAGGHAVPGDLPHDGGPDHADTDGHCAYCPLASQLTLLSKVPVVAPPPAWTGHAGQRFASARLPVATNLHGLGGQGPPADHASA